MSEQHKSNRISEECLWLSVCFDTLGQIFFSEVLFISHSSNNITTAFHPASALLMQELWLPLISGPPLGVTCQLLSELKVLPSLLLFSPLSH